MTRPTAWGDIPPTHPGRGTTVWAHGQGRGPIAGSRPKIPEERKASLRIGTECAIVREISRISKHTLSMALQAKQTTQQRLMLAPNVTLALEILRMPTMELRAFLEHQMEENPLLEVTESQEEEPQSTSSEVNGEEEPPQQTLDDDWLSQWNTVGEREEPNDERDNGRFTEQRLVRPQSLYESLRLQLGCLKLSDQERALGEAIIHRLDEYGYLEGSLDELSGQVAATPEQLEAALRVIQHLDPPGVGARNLRECLMIQLEYAGERETLAYRILADDFGLFVQSHISALTKTTGASREDITKACERLKQLNPKPGRAFACDLPPSIIPDLVISKQEKHYDVELNDQDVPHVTVNRAYYRMLKDPRTPSDAREFLANKFRGAKWLIKAIDERNATLLSIARCLISLQGEFLEHGTRAIKPLTQAQVASLIGRHPSTVSRAIASKTIDTPYGIFRLEQLFASSVPQHTANDTISDETIKSEIHRLIVSENPQHPFSDSALAERLAQRHISVARRTIAKYRTSLKILPAHFRKQRL